MARLVAKDAVNQNQVIALNLGVNRLGRSRANDFQIDHPSISPTHCQLLLSGDGVVVRDCASDNGTFVDGARVKEAKLLPGQVLRLGDVELLVETTGVTIAIPKFDASRRTSSLVSLGELLLCPRHPEAQATYRCTHCLQPLCEDCVRHFRRRGGRIVSLCPACNQPCELLCSCRCGARATHRCSRCYQGFCDVCVRKLRRSGGKVLTLCRRCTHECVLICPRHPEVRATYRCTQCRIAVCDACARRSRRRNARASRTCPFCRGTCELVCPRHPDKPATHQCTRCQEYLCDGCVQHLRGKSGGVLKFCSLCSHPCEPIEQRKPKKVSLLDRLQNTVKLRFVHGSKARRPKPAIRKTS